MAGAIAGQSRIAECLGDVSRPYTVECTYEPMGHEMYPVVSRGGRRGFPVRDSDAAYSELKGATYS